VPAEEFPACVGGGGAKVGGVVPDDGAEVDEFVEVMSSTAQTAKKSYGFRT